MKRSCFLLLSFLLLIFFSSCSNGDVPAYAPEQKQGAPGELSRRYSFSSDLVFFLRTDLLCGPDGDVSVGFGVDPECACDLSLTVLDENERYLGRIGRVRPGCFVQNMTLEYYPAEDYPIILCVYAYDAAGKEVRSTKIYTTLTVRK